MPEAWALDAVDKRMHEGVCHKMNNQYALDQKSSLQNEWIYWYHTIFKSHKSDGYKNWNWSVIVHVKFYMWHPLWCIWYLDHKYGILDNKLWHTVALRLYRRIPIYKLYNDNVYHEKYLQRLKKVLTYQCIKFRLISEHMKCVQQAEHIYCMFNY